MGALLYSDPRQDPHRQERSVNCFPLQLSEDLSRENNFDNKRKPQQGKATEKRRTTTPHQHLIFRRLGPRFHPKLTSWREAPYINIREHFHIVAPF